MSEQSSEPPKSSREETGQDRISVIRAWALVLLAVLAGGTVFLRGRRLVDNIIPVSTDGEAPAEVQPNE